MGYEEFSQKALLPSDSSQLACTLSSDISCPVCGAWQGSLAAGLDALHLTWCRLLSQSPSLHIFHGIWKPVPLPIRPEAACGFLSGLPILESKVDVVSPVMLGKPFVGIYERPYLPRVAPAMKQAAASTQPS